MDDREIITLLWHRDEGVLHVLADLYGPRLQRTANNILSNQADAEECVNDAYLAVWNTIPPRRPEPLAAYILRLCKNIAVSRFRRTIAQKRSSYEVALDELGDAIGTCTLDETVSARELGRAIDAFLGALPRENRILFLRRYYHGDDIASLSKHFSLSQGAISARLSRMREALKKFLIKEGLL